MHAVRDIRVNVRSAAVIAFALVALWFLSVWLGERAGKGFVSNLSLFWVSVFTFAPFIALLFAGLAMLLCFRSERAQWRWAYSALVAAAAPWLWYLTR